MDKVYFDSICVVTLMLVVTVSAVIAQHAEHSATPSSFRQGQAQQGEHNRGSSNGWMRNSNGYSSGAYASSSSSGQGSRGISGHEGGTVRISHEALGFSRGARTNSQSGHSSSNEGLGQELRSNVNLHGFGETNTEDTDNTEGDNQQETGEHSDFDPTASLWKSLGDSFAALGYMASSKSNGGGSVMRQAASLIAPLFSNLAQLLQMQGNPSRSE
ncbi:hypothetical protein RvY_05579 [Ramazzottius varieornatus]|uniref:Secreted protein n=1 Tax=Ramazzottius varieornatus TaxID=947166 RepID=A0A1D1UYK1_RAMVA|nr:hypothetical protein RvY_05579 [Ramazzottius varieornatus]